MQTYQDEYQVT